MLLQIATIPLVVKSCCGMLSPDNPENNNQENIIFPAFKDLAQASFKAEKGLEDSFIYLLDRLKLKSLNSVVYKSEDSANPPLNIRHAKSSSSNSKVSDLHKDQGTQSAHETILRERLKRYYLDRSVSFEVHTKAKERVRRHDFTFDIRRLGELAPDEISYSQTKLYSCRAEESRSGVLDLGHLALNSERVLPSHLAKDSPYRVSALLPLLMPAREGYGFSEVGVIVAFRDVPFTFEIIPYWSAEALNLAMQHAQDIGNDLLEGDAIPKSEISGCGIRQLQRPSAILALLFDAAAEHSYNNYSDELLCGISALTVEPQNRGDFQVTLAAFSLVYSDEILKNKTSISHLKSESKHHRVFQISVRRDLWGFLDIKILESKVVELFKLQPRNDLPTVVEPDVFAGLEDLFE